jgi:hypothetical protein
MKTSLQFSNEEVKELLAQRDFGYFLNKVMGSSNSSIEDKKEVNRGYLIQKKELLIEYQKNKKQFYFLLEGQVQKMFEGGFLPSILQLDLSYSQTILMKPEAGKNWAIFEFWANLYKKKVRKKKIWDAVVKIGSILGFLVAIKELIGAFIKSK